ncbi:MAG: hypothetical protein JOY66_07830 [Acetobacteraceae bacterium]|nr:hypothetical protein [Acetobacteraceae bacterium]
MSEAKLVQPTIWTLAGGGIQVRFSTAGPNLHYQDPHEVRDFVGQEIRLTEVSDLGVLVSVTLRLTVDSGSTSFTLLLPRVNLPAPPALPAAVPVETDGITTVHHLSLVPAFQHGQQDTYTVTQLRGTAA